MKLRNKKWSDDDFFGVRREVLEQWETGKQISNIEDGLKYLETVPDHKNFSKKLMEAKKKKMTLTQPRAGVAMINRHIELLNYLDRQGEADLLPTTIDSYTRQNRYHECERGIEESRKANRSFLNGFPAVNHGLEGCRVVFENVNKPLQARHGTPDARLLSEIIHASGWTSNEGGGISYNIPYAKNVSLEKTLLDWQYCDRLVGFYEENGIRLNREPFGPLTGTLVPPSISNAVAIIESLLAVEQGVKNITVGYGQCGNLIQDIAAIRALDTQCEEYLVDYGYHDIELTTVMHQWMGGFPENDAKAFALITYGSVTAALSGVTKVIVKTPDEAVGIPRMESNAQGLMATKMAINLLRGQRMPSGKKLVDEIEVIKAETKCIIDNVFKLGKGDLFQGVVKAFEVGAIDIPFAPSKYNAGKMMPARDSKGAVRYLRVGNIPFTKDIIDFNITQLEKRGKIQHRAVDFDMTVDDIFSVSKGILVGEHKDN